MPSVDSRTSRRTRASGLDVVHVWRRKRLGWADRARDSLGDMTSVNPHDPGYKAGFNTRAIHAGQEPDSMTGAVVPAIYQVSTYKQDGVGGLRGGYEYSRSANPTRTALEECLAALEGGSRAFAFASGLAGQDTTIRALLKPGDHVVVPTDAYGGTYRLLNKVALPWGVEHTVAKISDVAAVRAAIRPGQTKIVWVETPTNPLLGIADIAALATVAHEAGAILAVDNTFATPYLQQPLALGADVAVAAAVLGGRMHHDVGAEGQRLLEVGRGERVVDCQNGPGLVRDRRERRDVGNTEQWVGGRLDPDDLGLTGPDRSTHRRDVRDLGDGVLHPPWEGDLVQQAIGAAIGIGRNNHVVAGFEQRPDRGVLPRQAGGKRKSPAPALERGQTLLKSGAGRVGRAAVLVPAA